ncbi:unnamed protein product [Angiostrongylus costaricensis]|uniref:PH domain-containing protein n=1 Tax=Angiostrongylus costaricensis TaxID=334426 RepID=A0A3P7JKY2_ANGCS|nr:unnamed protein product [Angiostrongylus costaricensis]
MLRCTVENCRSQKKEYKDEKKRVAAQLISALRDPTVVVMADFLKVRGNFRKWSRFFCVLKPGLLIIYKSNKINKVSLCFLFLHFWTVLLSTCELIERPSKKDGFCFKLYQPLDQSIWATRGPLGESHGAVTFQPLPAAHLICRATDEQAGRCWMDALELSLSCSSLLLRTMKKVSTFSFKVECMTHPLGIDQRRELYLFCIEMCTCFLLYFAIFILLLCHLAIVCYLFYLHIYFKQMIFSFVSVKFNNTLENSQTEEVGDENKSLIWTLLRQIRPGMDLSKVILPTFILEPRSFLEKLADYYYHADLLSEASAEPDPYNRIVKIVKFYLSGFYKKPKGLKKPYNPILGETFRCRWTHPDGSYTYYIAEQVSHHPPISSLFVTNRKAGFNVAGTILAKSKYYGNSLSAIMNGTLMIALLDRGEKYVVTLPYASCKGIMIGTMTMELGGQVSIECEKTGYTAVLNFLLKPMFGGSMNKITGAVKLGHETLAEIEGFWDGQTKIKDGAKGDLWNPTPEVIKARLVRSEIDLDSQAYISTHLWHIPWVINGVDLKNFCSISALNMFEIS